jgi:hypothetical protein
MDCCHEWSCGEAEAQLVDGVVQIKKPRRGEGGIFAPLFAKLLPAPLRGWKDCVLHSTSFARPQARARFTRGKSLGAPSGLLGRTVIGTLFTFET